MKRSKFAAKKHSESADRKDIYSYTLQKTREIFFFNDVGDFSIESLLVRIRFLESLSKKPIIIKICSPGGAVDAGLALYDYIKSSKIPIYTECTGMAASMGAVLLASGRKGHRKASKNSRIMIHQPSAGFMGKVSDIEVHTKEVVRIKGVLNTLLSQDTGQPIKKVARDTEKDYWMTAEEALAYGIIDEII